MTTGAVVAQPRRGARRAWAGAAALAGLALVAGFALAPLRDAQPAASEATDAGGVSSAVDSASRRGQLEQQVLRHPRDGRAWALLAYDDFEAGRYREAAASFEKAIAASPKIAADPGVLCDYADALGMAQGGSLEGKPTEWIGRALAINADHPKALEMAGSAAYGRRDFAAAARYWQRLRARLAESSPARAALDAAIVRAEQLAATSLPAAR